MSDAKKICRKFIEIYENKQYWHNALAQYIEESQMTLKQIPENEESPTPLEKQSFVSFSNNSRTNETGSRAFVAQS